MTKNTGKSLYTEGTLRLTRSGVGYVESEQFKDDIEISSAFLNTGLNADRVRVLLHPKISDKRQSGEIAEILFRNKMKFTGVVQKNEESCFVVADDIKMNTDIVLFGNEAQKVKDGQKVYVKIIGWKDGKKNPNGEIIKILGEEGNNDAEMEAIVLDKGFWSDFPEDVEKEANLISKEISEDEIKKRRDMRNIFTITIDPHDAKDFDDAISIEYLENEKIEVGIHIADVSYFVRPNTKINEEATKRGTSIYLVDRTIPMLPEVLSNNLCSLKPNEDRLAFSAIFTMTKDGEIIKEFFGRTIIHSDKRFSYEEAQEFLDKEAAGSPASGGENNLSPVHKALLDLNDIAKKLRTKRFEEGAIDFDSEEVVFTLDEKGKPIGISQKLRLDTNKLIEEFMLLANKKVAEFINKKDKNIKKIFIYRIHDLPNQEKMENLIALLKSLGYNLKMKEGRVSSKDINNLFKEIEGKAEQNLIQLSTLRAMSKAVYSTDNIGHYGLAFKYYTHFTSPIRRYPDILVHRLLQKYIEGTEVKIEDLEMYKTVAEYSSKMEQGATDAERASIKYKQVEYMTDRIGKEYEGTITGVTQWGIYVAENKSKSEGMIKLSSLKDDFYTLDKKHHILKGEKKGKKFTLGDKVKIRVKSTDLKKRMIDYVFV